VATPPPQGTDDLIFYTAIAGKALGTEAFQQEMNARFGV